MKKRKLIFISSLLIMLAALAIFTGCKGIAPTISDNYQDEGYYRVFMYYNGGKGKVSNPYSKYFIDKGGAMPTPTSNNQLDVTEPTRSGYDFFGWYQIDDKMLDSRKQERLKEGQPVYDKNNETMKEDVWYIKGHDFLNPDSNVKELQLTPADVEANDPIFVQRDKDGNVRQWNFDFDRITDDTTLVALWRVKRQYVLLPVEHMYEDPDAEGFDELGIKKYDCLYDGSIIELRRTDASLPTRKGYQIEGFYLDTQFTTPVPFSGYKNRYYPVVTENDYKEDGELKTIRIYIKWISDIYTIVESAGDIPSEIKVGGIDYYVFRPSDSYYFKANINLSGNELRNRGTFRGKIEGNGYTLSNFRVDIAQNFPTSADKNRDYKYPGIFDKLDGSEIKNINFEAVTYNFYHTDLSSLEPMSRKEILNAFASDINNSSEIRNVKVGTTVRSAQRSFFQSIFQNVKSEADYKGYFYNGNLLTADNAILNIPLKYLPPKNQNGDEQLPIFVQANNFDIKGIDTQGNPIPYESHLVINCSIDVDGDPNGDVWKSPYEMEVDESNYRTLPKFPNAGILTFYGWCTVDGKRIDLTREWIPELDDGTYYAMWIGRPIS